MTEDQQKALAKAYVLLADSFDHVLIVVRDKEKPGLAIQSDEQICWDGGWITAKHLADAAIKRLHYSHMTRHPPSVTQEIMNSVMKKPE